MGGKHFTWATKESVDLPMISCEKHDYIEIACTFRYLVKLKMKSGKVLECIALDTVLDSNRAECIKVESQGNISLVVLDDISVLEACIENPHFDSVVFS